jgi:hypothetical protein
MARRLTKKTLSGTVLERLPQVETELDELAALPLAILLQRIATNLRGDRLLQFGSPRWPVSRGTNPPGQPVGQPAY